MDMRGPSRAAECFDCVVAFPTAVERMRATGDDHDLAQTMIAGTRVAFEALESPDRHGLLFVASAGQDLLYRYVMRVTILDRYTRAYCSQVVRYFCERLSERDIRTFYILDNTLRDDRFAATLELFELSGIVTTTPGRDGLAWSPLATRLRASLDAVGHAAYIEPDALVNHLDAARQLAGEIPCVATFRNLAPDNPRHEIINFREA
jgi:hypothetical protein